MSRHSEMNTANQKKILKIYEGTCFRSANYLIKQKEMSSKHQMRHRSVVVITTAQLQSTKSEIRLCADSNPDRRVRGYLK